MIRRLAILCAVLLWVVPGAAGAVETIPFTYENGLIHLNGSVDGQAPVPMLLDLGAGIDILSERLAHLVAFKGKYTTLRLTGQRLDLPMGDVVSLALGEARVGDRSVGVWNGLYAARGVDGLISAEAFRDTAATIDFTAHQIIVEDAVSFPERRRTATRVPLILQDDLNTALAVFARFNFGHGRSGLCLIDTGRKDIAVDDVFKKDGISSIELDGAPQTKINNPPVKYENLIYDCMVGNDFWQGRSFTLEVVNRAMWVQQQI
ncbi:MAG TPA: hypothetical protein VFE36_15050, partial [Candidatus Baltobacteraceae bacterium]|nr:hypothetical protein [Candidatus Baltobacteraceae bacterium]